MDITVIHSVSLDVKLRLKVKFWNLFRLKWSEKVEDFAVKSENELAFR